jgi:hypothetical protein
MNVRAQCEPFMLDLPGARDFLCAALDVHSAQQTVAVLPGPCEGDPVWTPGTEKGEEVVDALYGMSRYWAKFTSEQRGELCARRPETLRKLVLPARTYRCDAKAMVRERTEIHILVPTVSIWVCLFVSILVPMVSIWGDRTPRIRNGEALFRHSQCLVAKMPGLACEIVFYARLF